MTTVADLVRAHRDYERANYIDNEARRQREKDDARRRMRAMLPPDIPPLPGMTIRLRFMGALVVSSTPETLDWSQVTEWQPII